jgi:hypothetical protein
MNGTKRNSPARMPQKHSVGDANEGKGNRNEYSKVNYSEASALEAGKPDRGIIECCGTALQICGAGDTKQPVTDLLPL